MHWIFFNFFCTHGALDVASNPSLKVLILAASSSSEPYTLEESSQWVIWLTWSTKQSIHLCLQKKDFQKEKVTVTTRQQEWREQQQQQQQQQHILLPVLMAPGDSPASGLSLTSGSWCTLPGRMPCPPLEQGWGSTRPGPDQSREGSGRPGSSSGRRTHPLGGGGRNKSMGF